MVFRAEVEQRDAIRTVEVEGLLDVAAVDELLVRLHLRGGDHLVLRAGTEVTADAIERLRTLPAQVTSESPYLAHLLAQEAHEREEPR
jgi:hypothetical protein